MNQDALELYRKRVVQISTPFVTGTGLVEFNPQLVVTNEHLVRDVRHVIVSGAGIKPYLSEVLFKNPKLDLAFVSGPSEEIGTALELSETDRLKIGMPVAAIGHPLGLKLSLSGGVVSKLDYHGDSLVRILHDATLNPGNSGGPLVDPHGSWLGMNSFVYHEARNIGSALPAKVIVEQYKAYLAKNSPLVQVCGSCESMVSDEELDQGYCPVCGSKLESFLELDEYEAAGMDRSLEQIISYLGYDVRLCRRGLRKWELERGSAVIYLSYHEKTGLIMADSKLCRLPGEGIEKIYVYLLQQNHELEGLRFSISDDAVYLSVMIDEQYLDIETGVEALKKLLDKSDDYDDVLVEEYGCHWSTHWEV